MQSEVNKQHYTKQDFYSLFNTFMFPETISYQSQRNLYPGKNSYIFTFFYL